MPRFLTTQGTAYHIENIIRNARNKLILITPYLQLTSNFYDRLKDVDDKGIMIELIYGKEQLNECEIEKLSFLNNIKLYFKEN